MWNVVGRLPATRRTTFHAWKIRGCQCSFRLLMMGGVSPETCWASYKYGIMIFWYIVASCWIFLYEFYYDARIHKHQICGFSVWIFLHWLSFWRLEFWRGFSISFWKVVYPDVPPPHFPPAQLSKRPANPRSNPPPYWQIIRSLPLTAPHCPSHPQPPSPTNTELYSSWPD